MKLVNHPISLPSDEKFGLFFAFVFSFVAIVSTVFYGNVVLGVIAALLCLAFLITAFVKPSALRGLNKSWAYLGLLIGMIVSPIVLGVMYFGMFTPLAAILRLKGRDELRLRTNKQETYWIKRDPVGPSPESFKEQH